MAEPFTETLLDMTRKYIVSVLNNDSEENRLLTLIQLDESDRPIHRDTVVISKLSTYAFFTLYTTLYHIIKEKLIYLIGRMFVFKGTNLVCNEERALFTSDGIKHIKDQ